jgi:hypothetical protein
LKELRIPGTAIKAPHAWPTHAWFTLAFGALFAAIAPFNPAFAFLTGGSSLARVTVILILGSVGILCARQTGLRIESTGLRRPFLTLLAIAAGVALEIVIVDCVLFRSMLRPDYVALFRNQGLGFRTCFFMLAAYVENIEYRLFLMSALVWVIGSLWRGSDGRPANGAFWTAMTLAQVVNIAVNVVPQAAGPITPLVLAYDGLRYLFPGVVWGYLYWRHGFVAAEIASVGTHPFLQPQLGYFL